MSSLFGWDIFGLCKWFHHVWQLSYILQNSLGTRVGVSRWWWGVLWNFGPALSWIWDHLIPRNPSSAIFRYLHPCCFPSHGNQLRKPKIHGRLSYFDNKKYNCELFQLSNCWGCARARARIFVVRFDGNEGWPSYCDWHEISQHHYFGKYATTSLGLQSWRPCYLIEKSRCSLGTL